MLVYMTRFFVLLITIAGFVYADFGADNLWTGVALPAVAVVGLAYLFWFRGFVAIAVGAVAFYLTDVESESLIRAVLMPIVVGLAAIYLSWWARMQLWADFVGSGGDVGGDIGGGGADG